MRRLELPDADAEVIKQFIGWMEDRLMEGDFDSWIQHWDEDGVVMPPGRPRVVGREAVKAYAKELVQGIVSLCFTDWELFGQDKIAVVRKNMELTRRTDDGGTRTLRAKQVVVLVKGDDSQWLVQTIISNGDETA